jgi:hypothetical protein
VVPISQPTEQEVRGEISREIKQIYEQSHERPIGSASALVSDGWVIVVLDNVELAPNEQFLVDKGEHDQRRGTPLRG